MLCLDYWKPIEGYEGKYSVSYCGFVRSLKRYAKHYAGGVRLVKTKYLRLRTTTKGYSHVVLCNGKQVTQKVHRLVGKAFVKNPNNYPQINHIVGVKKLNIACNLEWCSNNYNCKHAYDNNLVPKGEKSYKSILSEVQVLDIKQKLLEGCKNSKLANKYNVNPGTISAINSGKSWKHVKV